MNIFLTNQQRINHAVLDRFTQSIAPSKRTLDATVTILSSLKRILWSENDLVSKFGLTLDQPKDLELIAKMVIEFNSKTSNGNRNVLGSTTFRYDPRPIFDWFVSEIRLYKPLLEVTGDHACAFEDEYGPCYGEVSRVPTPFMGNDPVCYGHLLYPRYNIYIWGYLYSS